MLALKIIGILFLICFLIGRIRVGADFSVMDGRIALSAKLCGISLQLIPRRKKKKKKIPAQPEESTGGEETQKKKKEKKTAGQKKKKKPFFKLDIYDIRELLSAVVKGLKKFGSGFNCERLLIDFTCSFRDPYTTAKVFAYVNAFLSAFAPVFEEKNNCRDCRVNTQLDFNSTWPKLDFGICVTFRIGAAFGMVFSILFKAIWIFLKIIFRFLRMRIFDKEEYEFRMNDQEGPIAFFKRVLREAKEIKDISPEEQNAPIFMSNAGDKEAADSSTEITDERTSSNG